MLAAAVGHLLTPSSQRDRTPSPPAALIDHTQAFVKIFSPPEDNGVNWQGTTNEFKVRVT